MISPSDAPRRISRSRRPPSRESLSVKVDPTSVWSALATFGLFERSGRTSRPGRSKASRNRDSYRAGYFSWIARVPAGSFPFSAVVKISATPVALETASSKTSASSGRGRQ